MPSEFVQIGSTVFRRAVIDSLQRTTNDEGKACLKIVLDNGWTWTVTGVAFADAAAVLVTGEGGVASGADCYFVSNAYSEVYHEVPYPRSGPDRARCGFDCVWPDRLTIYRSDMEKAGLRLCGHCARALDDADEEGWI